MAFNSDGSDRFRILKYLYLTPADLPLIDAAMANATTQSLDLVAMIMATLDELDSINASLDQELSSNSGSLIKAGPLEWSEDRFVPIILNFKIKIQGLGRLLGLRPNLSILDDLLSIYGQGGTRVGGLCRN